MKEYSSLCNVSIIIIQICKNGIVFNTAISIFQETALNPIRMCYDIPLLYINTSLEIRVNESSCTYTHITAFSTSPHKSFDHLLYVTSVNYLSWNRLD